MTADKPRRRVWPIVAVLVLLPVLYVASIGPAFGVMPDGWVHPNVLMAFYSPVWTAADWLGHEQVVNDYIEFWLGLGL